MLAKAVAYGATTALSAKPALQAEPWNPEVGVLVGELQVARVVGGLRHAPGRLQRRPILDLAADDQPVGLLDQALGRRSHDQRRHQILEHRA